MGYLAILQALSLFHNNLLYTCVKAVLKSHTLSSFTISSIQTLVSNMLQIQLFRLVQCDHLAQVTHTLPATLDNNSSTPS